MSSNLVVKDALKHLKKDKKFALVIKRFPEPELKKGKSAYEALIRSIVYQQLSGKAAGTILNRFLDIYNNNIDIRRRYPKPEEVLKTPVSKLRKVGLSGQKVEYVRDLSRKFLDGTIEPRKFNKMTDEEIREHVIAVKGIGRWSADMFLMFTLNRPNVLPVGDLGIQKGFQRLFKLKELPTEEKMKKLAKPWQPYRTIASMYLWKIADEGNKNRPK